MGIEINRFCTGCNKPAEKIEKYIEGAEDLGISLAEYVETEEGTYNPANGHFLCTDCYIKAGMPANPYPGNGWVAP